MFARDQPPGFGWVRITGTDMERHFLVAGALLALGLGACDPAVQRQPGPATQIPKQDLTTETARNERETAERQETETLRQLEADRPVTRNGITLAPSDEGANAFMALAISCGSYGGEATMQTFLSMRVAQARAAGISLSYEANSIVIGGDRVVVLSERTSMRDGREIPGYPAQADFFYIVDWTGARLARTVPATPSPDPVSFMRTNPEAICDTIVARKYRAERAARGPSPNAAEQPVANAEVAPEVLPDIGSDRPSP